jgi:hypothetical protein
MALDRPLVVAKDRTKTTAENCAGETNPVVSSLSPVEEERDERYHTIRRARLYSDT